MVLGRFENNLHNIEQNSETILKYSLKILKKCK